MKKFLKIIYILLITITLITGFYIYKGYKLYKESIKDISIEEIQKEIKSKENFCEITKIPQIYINAVISVEDHRFYKHHGIDIIAIGRAFIHDIKAWDFIEGGSTITQQLAKNLYFTQEKTIERKIAEIFMATKIEKELKKDEILELYINTSYYGNGYYTIKEASVGYFGKEPENLNDNEATMLAGIPNAPSIYAPSENMILAKQRQKQVLNKMVEYKYITKKEAETLFKEAININ